MKLRFATEKIVEDACLIFLSLSCHCTLVAFYGGLKNLLVDVCHLLWVYGALLAVASVVVLHFHRYMELARGN